MIAIPLIVTAAVFFGLARARTLDGSTIVGPTGPTPNPAPKPSPSSGAIAPKGSIVLAAPSAIEPSILAAAAGGTISLADIASVAVNASEVSMASIRGPIIGLRRQDASFAPPVQSAVVTVPARSIIQYFPPGSGVA